MVNVSEIRRINLDLLVKEHGLTYVSKRMNRSKQQISSMVLGDKSFGEVVARRLEQEWDPGAKPGWLDQENEKVNNYIKAKKKISEEDINLTINAIESSSVLPTDIIIRDQNSYVRNITITQSWLDSQISNYSKQDNLYICTHFGQSMRDLLEPGDILIVDTFYKSIEAGGIYLFSIENEAFVRRFQHTPDDGLIATAGNNAFRDWKMQEINFKVYGKVLLSLKTKKL